MPDMRSKNKGVVGCPKRSEKLTGCLACRWWLVVSSNGRGGLVGWPNDRGWLHHIFSRVPHASIK